MVSGSVCVDTSVWCCSLRANVTPLFSWPWRSLAMTHTWHVTESLMRHTSMLPALLIRCATVDTSTQRYLELEFALAETTQRANKSPRRIGEDTEPPSTRIQTHVHSEGDVSWYGVLIKSVLYQPVSLGHQKRFTTAITLANYKEERGRECVRATECKGEKGNQIQRRQSK